MVIAVEAICMIAFQVIYPITCNILIGIIFIQKQTLVSGMPQGSVFGPLLFSLYVNDLPLHNNFYVHLFADDIVLSQI